jgi:hypothetical protein
MGRRGMKYCLLCNVCGNGSSGDVVAIAKYYIPKSFRLDDGSKPGTTGWIPVCRYCADSVKRWNPQFELIYFNTDDESLAEIYYHKLGGSKINLVSNEDGTDTFICEKCGKKVNVRMGQRSVYGCSIPDVVGDTNAE